MGTAAVRLASQVGYTGAGTLEFLYEDEQFFFLEMNTRIQVEHTVTEAITGIDLVKWQIRVAQGDPLPWTQDQITLHGHAIECRINAEDPAAGFRPALGTLSSYREPHGFGVRVDSGYIEGSTIPQYYDSLVAKLVTWGQDREEAIARMRRALADFSIEGIRTTIPFHQAVMNNAAFQQGEATVRFIGEHITEAQLQSLAQPDVVNAANGDVSEEQARTFEVEVNGRRFQVRVAGTGPATDTTTNGASAAQLRRGGAGKRTATHAADANAITSPIQGTVVAIRVQPGAQVEAGSIMFVVEAMKMENEITAPRAGIVKEVRVTERAAVQAGEALAVLV
jgi:acetyl-CoA/propionyl-CoA carboxylase biotin carboxyl carrier protein